MKGWCCLSQYFLSEIHTAIIGASESIVMIQTGKHFLVPMARLVGDNSDIWDLLLHTF